MSITIAAIILFIWFTFLQVVGLGLTTYAYIKDPKMTIDSTTMMAFIFVLPIFIAACAEVIW